MLAWGCAPLEIDKFQLECAQGGRGSYSLLLLRLRLRLEVVAVAELVYGHVCVCSVSVSMSMSMSMRAMAASCQLLLLQRPLLARPHLLQWQRRLVGFVWLVAQSCSIACLQSRLDSVPPPPPSLVSLLSARPSKATRRSLTQPGALQFSTNQTPHHPRNPPFIANPILPPSSRSPPAIVHGN